MPDLPTSLALTSIQTNAQILSADHRNNYAAIQVAVNALIAALSGGSSKQLLLATDSDTVAWAGAYTAYTPTWASSGVAPAIGNAVVVAQYLQIGKMIHAYGHIIFGGTSTYGTGNYTFALPVTASANAANNEQPVGVGFVRDNSAAVEGMPTGYCPSTTTLGFRYGATYLGTTTVLGAAAPWAFAVGDTIAWNILYEAA